MRFIFKIIKRIIVSSFLLYGYNLIAVNFNLVIPINIFNIMIISILGVPSLIGLIIFKIFVLWGDFMELTIPKKRFNELINNIVKFNRISHAYLIEVDNYDNDYSYVIDFIKKIINDESANLLIDNGSYPDLKIIEPDGNVIKKAQLLALQEQFKNKSFLNNKMIYIIKEAEKLNDSSGNTILKFLEEPEEDIVAFLLTTNRYKIIETILSRCQIISLKDDSYNTNLSDNILDMLKFIVKRDDLFIYHQYIMDNILVDKTIAKEILGEIEVIILKYLNYISNKGSYCDESVINILKDTSIDDLTNYISIIEEELQKLDFNVNYKLWLDCLFARLIGG